MAIELHTLGESEEVLRTSADVAAERERIRLARVRRLTWVLSAIALWLGLRQVSGNPVSVRMPEMTPEMLRILPMFLVVLIIATMVLLPMLAMGRSPHILYRPGEIDVRLDDVKGAKVVTEEIVKTLNLFLAHKTFKERMGGTPRRAILFEGPPGTGKTYMAKAMAREAGVPFLFVSSSAFQSMYYGQTNRKIRSYFKALRQHARREGGAIGFIEEIDAIGASRAGMGGKGEGVTGVVNELLIQLQSFDEPTVGRRLWGWFVDRVNRWLPAHIQLRKGAPQPANILLIGATNRASDLDAALLRPGRFDRSVYFDLPSRAGRREIIDYYLTKKSHAPELDDPGRRETLAAMTTGYSPVMIEHLFDEALVWALRRGADALNWSDIQKAKMTEEIGLAQPVEYTEAERRTIATHESGHATVAYLVGKARKLEVLSIIKRKDALGLLSHSDLEERFTSTKTEIEALIQIALGGMVSEEIFFGEISSGAGSDLTTATTYAAMMYGSLGMMDSLISFDAVKTASGSNIVAKVISDRAGRAAVEGLLEAARDNVRRMLDSHRGVVEALRDALLEREELIAEEITEVIERALAPTIDLTAPFAVDRAELA